MLRQANTSPVTLYAPVKRGSPHLSSGDNSAAGKVGGCLQVVSVEKCLNIWTKRTQEDSLPWPAC